jgi:hypothetical protein
MIDAQNSISKLYRLYTGISRKYLYGTTGLTKYEYLDIVNNWISDEDYKEFVIPSILPNWDDSPRSGKRATILQNSSPEIFEKHVSEMMDVVRDKRNKILFLKSWNEWAEGNYVEPDLRYGTQYLDALRKYLI